MTVPSFRSDAPTTQALAQFATLLFASCAPIASFAQQAAVTDPWAFVQPAADATGPDAASGTDDARDAPETRDPNNQEQSKDHEASKNQEAALPDPATIDWSLLNADPSKLHAAPRKTSGAAAGKPDAGPSTWSRNDKPAGFSAVTVKQPVLPFWDTRVGADLNVAGQSTLPAPLPEKLATDGRLSQSSGAAWAAMTAPGLGPVWDKTAIEARLDPSQEQSKIGTSISKSLPLDGNAYALTLQGGYNVIEQSLGPIVGGNGRPMRNYEADHSAKLSISDTGTSFLAGQSLSTAEDKWLRSVGAEQKLFGGVSVTGTVSETISGNLNKSLTAGFKKTW
jgi:hypothetical protein